MTSARGSRPNDTIVESDIQEVGGPMLAPIPRGASLLIINSLP